MQDKTNSVFPSSEIPANSASVELLSKLAHDFNDLLVGIHGSARMILDGEMVKPEGMPLMEQILSCAERAAELTRDIQSKSEPNIPGSELLGMLGGGELTKPISDEELKPNEKRPVVLFIDDEHVVRSVGRSILERAGFKVLTASNGEEGIHKFEQHSHKIKCVILDMVMPYMSGNLVFAKLKAARPDVRVVLISGYTDKQTLRQFQEHEIEGFLQKPFSPDALVNKVTEIVQREAMSSSVAQIVVS